MEASVEFLLGNLKHLMLYEAESIGDAFYEVKLLNGELASFKSTLTKECQKYKKDQVYEEWEQKITEAVCHIEDVIDDCAVIQAASGRKANVISWFRSRFSGTDENLLAEKVRNLREETVKPLVDEFQAAKFTIAETDILVADDSGETRNQKSQHIGYETVANEVVNLLTQESNKLEICSIVGKFTGMGKTTLAHKIFDDVVTRNKQIPVGIWVTVSPEFNMKRVLLQIQRQLPPFKPDTFLTNEVLVKKVKDQLAAQKFLMVFDDISNSEEWGKLKDLLPTDNKWGRVLITTQDTDVGKMASTLGDPEKISLRMEAKQSWELLQYRVFGDLGKVPQKLEKVGSEIAKDCRGIRLYILVIAETLGEIYSRSGSSLSTIKAEWKEVSKKLKEYSPQGDTGGDGLLRHIIRLTYKKLPYGLKNCFLYLVVFPEDADIPVRKLIRLWTAEGFVQERRGKTLEDVARHNLNKLIDRNLAVVTRRGEHGGEVKTCQIHECAREMCITERWYESINLFLETSTAPQPPSDINEFRRVCIHSSNLHFVRKHPKFSKARSLLCSSKSRSPVSFRSRDITYLTETFSLLRVYDSTQMMFPRFPRKFVQQLNHLRYLTLAVTSKKFKVLPEIVTSLWNLQTLIVETPSRTLECEGDICKLRHLRHFKSHASIILKQNGVDKGGEKLQTLSRLWPESCTVEICEKATRLLTLGIQGDLSTLGNSKGLGSFKHLNKLKLVHQVSPGGVPANPLIHLPNSDCFPPNLKILVLSGTCLDWSKMSIFSGIVSLEVLKLKENAFQGNTWVADGSGFANLVALYIERADLQNWTTSDNDFPKLKFLHIHKCEKLTEIPSHLGKKLVL